MSYILDALKRADADRERGHVPGLHSQGKHHPATGPGVSWRRQTVWVTAVLLLLAAAALGWWSLRTPDASTVPDVHTAAASVEPVEPGVPASADAESPTSAPTMPSVPTPPSVPILSPEPPDEAQVPAPARPPSTPPRPPPDQATTTAGEANVEADAGDKADTTTETEDTADPSATPPPPPRQTILPPRPAAPRPPAAPDASGRPPVRVSGSSYSQNPAHRMLIANGKVVHEGQEIEPGLKLETVGPRSAVLNHRGTLYNITY